MAAERKNASEPQRREHLTLVALYELEERANELLERLSALKIDTSEASIVRVELSSAPRAAGSPPLPNAAQLSPLIRYPVTGAVIGSGAALLIGALLYEADLLSLSFAEGLFAHALVSVLIGALIGAGIGVLRLKESASLCRPLQCSSL
jgi:hypothetical protein